MVPDLNPPLGAARGLLTDRARLPGCAAALAILAQIAYPLARGPARATLTIAGVLLFFTACASHALLRRGARWTAGWLGVSLAAGLAVEAIGVHTGVPFGRYTYGTALGAEWAGVPVIIPLAWAMMTYPALLVGRRIGRRRATQILAGGWALASWDLFLDPQMVAAGYWRWDRADGPALLGIPLTNDAGWLLTSLALLAVLTALLPPDRRDALAPGGLARGGLSRGGLSRGGLWRSGLWRSGDAVPIALYLWTYGGSVLANVAFFGRPWVGVLGGLGMGPVVLAYLRAARQPR